MRILCVAPNYWPAFQYGGPVFSLHGLNRALRAKGIDITVYTTNVGLDGSVPANREVDVDGVKVYYFEYSRHLEFLGTTGWQFSWPMSQALKKNLNGFDLVYISAVWNYTTAIAAHYSRLYNKSYVLAPRGMLYPYSIGRKAWKKWPYYKLITHKDIKNAAAIHYTTQHEADQCHKVLGLTNQALILPNGVDRAGAADAAELHDRYPVLKDKKVILFLSRISWKKGLDLLIAAYGRVARERQNVHLLIVGPDEGDYAKKVRAWIEKEAVSEQVTFTGMLTGGVKAAAYLGSDIFVLPSYSENFGMVVVEAMACGLPVVVSDQVGLCREVEKAKAGLVVSTDVDQLTATLLKLLDDPGLCLEMGENGRRLASTEFSWDVIAANALVHYNQVLGTS